MEAHELSALKSRTLPDFILPEVGTPVVRYNTCHSHNVVYRSVNHGVATRSRRDCFVAYDFPDLRAYGEVKFFLRLPIKDKQAVYFYVAYVEWFQQRVDEPWSIYRTHAAQNKAANRAIPIGDVICKIALIAESQRGQKCAVLELLWCVRCAQNFSKSRFRRESVRKFQRHETSINSRRARPPRATAPPCPASAPHAPLHCLRCWRTSAQCTPTSLLMGKAPMARRRPSTPYRTSSRRLFSVRTPCFFGYGRYSTRFAQLD